MHISPTRNKKSFIFSSIFQNLTVQVGCGETQCDIELGFPKAFPRKKIEKVVMTTTGLESKDSLKRLIFQAEIFQTTYWPTY